MQTLSENKNKNKKRSKRQINAIVRQHSGKRKLFWNNSIFFTPYQHPLVRNINLFANDKFLFNESFPSSFFLLLCFWFFFFCLFNKVLVSMYFTVNLFPLLPSNCPCFLCAQPCTPSSPLLHTFLITRLCWSKYYLTPMPLHSSFENILHTSKIFWYVQNVGSFLFLTFICQNT